MSLKLLPLKFGFCSVGLVLFLNFAPASAALVHAQDRTYTLSVTERGAVPDDSSDDGPAFQQTLNDVSLTGGTILIPAGRWLISTEISLNSPGRSIRFLGSGNDSVIVVNTSSSRTLYLANLENVSFEQLTFITADPASGNDAEQILRIDGAKMATIRDCNFYGIATKSGPTSAAIWFFNSFGILERVGFYGSTSSNGLVLWSSFRGAVARNVTFLDYGEHNGVGYSKIPTFGNSGAWIEVREPTASPQNASTAGSCAVIENFVGDEGAISQILINPSAGGAAQRLHSARLSNINANLGAGVLGIEAHDVDTFDILHSWFGYTSNHLTAVKLRGLKKATLYGVTLGQGIDRYDIDASNVTVEIIASSPTSLPCAAQTCRQASSYAEMIAASSLGGSGTTGRLARWTGESFLSNSSITDDGAAVQFSGGDVTFSNTGGVTFSNSGPVAFSNSGGVSFAGNVNLGGAPTLPITRTSQDLVLGPQHAVVLVDASLGFRVIYLPSPAKNIGKIYTIKKIDDSSFWVKIESRTFSKDHANIDNGQNLTFSTRYASFTVISDGTDWWVISRQ